MSHFINEDMEVLPEVIRDGMLVGHTSNYLQVRYKGDTTQLNQITTVHIDSIAYPYLEAHAQKCEIEEVEVR